MPRKVNPSQPKHIQRGMPPAVKVRGWFKDALGSRGQIPTLEDCTEFARELQIEANRFNSIELMRQARESGAPPPPLQSLPFVLPKDIEEDLLKRFKISADRLLLEAERIEKFNGGYYWDDANVHLSDIQIALSKIGSYPRSHNKRQDFGRPPEPWHEVGRLIAKLIRDRLILLGHRSSLKMTHGDSVTAAIAASAVSWAYGMNISAEGFASAMRPRNRRKIAAAERHETFDQRFPDAARIRVL